VDGDPDPSAKMRHPDVAPEHAAWSNAPKEVG
jgi:hypothetical protein